MKLLVVYATTEGQTRKIADWTADRLRAAGHELEVMNSAGLVSDLDLSSFDAFILAGSVHHEHHQRTLIDFATAHRETLNAGLSAFISVSLSAVLEEGMAEAQKYASRFSSETGWTPGMTLLIGGAARFSEYDFFQEQVIRFIVMRRGGSADTDQDKEFTDWAELGAFVDKFVGEVPQAH